MNRGTDDSVKQHAIMLTVRWAIRSVRTAYEPFNGCSRGRTRSQSICSRGCTQVGRCEGLVEHSCSSSSAATQLQRGWTQQGCSQCCR